MKGSVRGLTTAAGIWMIAAIGMAVGVGMYWTALIATLLILFILVQLEKFEHRISLGAEARIIRLKVTDIVKDIEPYRTVLNKRRVVLTSYYVDYEFNENVTRLNLMVLIRDNIDYIDLFREVREVYATDSITLSTQASI